MRGRDRWFPVRRAAGNEKMSKSLGNFVRALKDGFLLELMGSFVVSLRHFEEVE